MEISEIVNLQKQFDQQHGWDLKTEKTSEKLNLITKDLVGIMGELGEFSNLVKKLNLLSDISLETEISTEFKSLTPQLKEELIDTFIYLIRISSHLEMDLSEEYIKKYTINKERFRKYENK